jgi:hypothetical protein
MLYFKHRRYPGAKKAEIVFAATRSLISKSEWQLCMKSDASCCAGETFSFMQNVFLSKISGKIGRKIKHFKIQRL